MLKTIVVHTDDTERSDERIRVAAGIAALHGSHVVGVAMTGISSVLYQSGSFGYIDPVSMSVNMDFLADRAKKTLERFEEVMRTTAVDSYEKRLIDDEPGGGLSLQARYSDLVIIGQSDDGKPAASVFNDFPQYVVLHGARPVLIVPYTGTFPVIGKRILLAWDGSLEATRAVTHAMPFMKRADAVDVVIFNQPESSTAGIGEAGADIALYLARHDIKVNVSRQTTNIDIGNALLSCAADMASDLIVMGCYGHSRFREVLLGGVTRTVLKSMTVPVLMSH